MCNKEKICLIIDEITTGWRETNGGIYKLIGLKPDIVVYGKSIGNGYAISVIVGKKKYIPKIHYIIHSYFIKMSSTTTIDTNNSPSSSLKQKFAGKYIIQLFSCLFRNLEQIFRHLGFISGFGCVT